MIVILALVQAVVAGHLYRQLGRSRPTVSSEIDIPASSPSTRRTSSDAVRPAEVETASDEVALAIDEEPVGRVAARAVDISGIAKRFDPERAMEHIRYLASDELGGRQPGTLGGRAAGEYIADQFAACGLQPAGIEHTYYQTFTVPYGQFTSRPVLEIRGPIGRLVNSTYDYRTDYRALTGGYLGAGEGEGQVVWLNGCGHEDYSGVDVVDKIVLCRSGSEQAVYREAIAHGVGGLLLLDRDTAGEPFRRGGYRETAWVPETVPAYLISESVGRDLLTGTDYTLDSLSLRYSATPLSTTVRIAVTTEEEEAIAARNVLGFLPGSDPRHRHEVVVVGAHYDHLGPEPDGTIMNGANDNASGVATVLEIARLWQAEDFDPARSVLFAAWDGEEQGLLGSRHYVENPTQSITRTVSMLNLDMVGAGEALRIDGEGAVAAQLSVAAEAYGATVTSTFGGGSDHVPFYSAGVPAGMLIWWPDELYHTPDDEISAIDPGRLRMVGVLASHTLGAIAEGDVELRHTVDQLEASVAAGDREAFSAMLASPDPWVQHTRLSWFDNLWSRGLTDITLRADQILIGVDEAWMTLRAAPRWDGEEVAEASVSYPAHFTRQSGTWGLAGYGLEEASAGGVTVATFPGGSVDASDMLSVTLRIYTGIAADLGADPVAGTRFVYYPDEETLRAVTRPAAEGGIAWQAPSSSLAEVAIGLDEGTCITAAVVSLVLNQMGLPPDQGEWLREGLVARYETQAALSFLPTLASKGPPSSRWFLGGSPFLTADRDSVGTADADQTADFRAHAWSATDYLLDEFGRGGLHSLCGAWGDSGARSAFKEGLGVRLEAFETAWRQSRIDALRTASNAIRETISQRQRAVLDGDEAGFLSTATLSDRLLRAEERSWFNALTDGSPGAEVVSYTVQGAVVGWMPGESEARVMLEATTVASGSRPSRVSFESRFVRELDRWVYAGEAWENLTSEHYLLHTKRGMRDEGDWVLKQAEEVYEQITTDLATEPSLPQAIRVFSDEACFRSSAARVLSEWDRSWTARAESIRLLADPEDEGWLREGMARELTRQILYHQGLKSPWIEEGLTCFEADRVLPLGPHWGAAVREKRVRDALTSREALSWSQLNAVDILETEDLALVRAQAWSWIVKLERDYGIQGLRRFLVEASSRADATAAMREALGIEPEAFVDEWRDEVQSYGAPERLVALARRFDPERAINHIRVLSAPEYGGREAGSPEGAQAASYIAEQFAALDLAAPWGALSSDVLTAAMPYTDVAGYLQMFPISYTRVVTVPTLSLLGDDEADGAGLSYRRDFVEVGGRGSGEGELVWLASTDLEGLRFGGALVVERDVSRPLERAVALEEHGAAGLIIAGDRTLEVSRNKVGTAEGVQSGETIPVIELSDEGLAALLAAVDMMPETLASSPRVLPLGAQGRLVVPATPTKTVYGANILGFWPGTDPRLSQEVLVVGAHYDHIGRLADGRYFPGANQNASGVATMLELARLWREESYQPARTVLFTAWGGGERNSAGVSHYLARPIVPLTRTVGVISLDSVADGEGCRLWFHGDKETDGALTYRVEGSAAQLGHDAWRKGSSDQGWHHLFKMAGVPSAKLTWAESEGLAYRFDDTAERIDLHRLTSSGEVVALAVSWLADH